MTSNKNFSIRRQFAWQLASAFLVGTLFTVAGSCQRSGGPQGPSSADSATPPTTTPPTTQAAPAMPPSTTQTQLVAAKAESKSPVSPIEPDPQDWLSWRGPTYDGVSHETGLIDDFDPEGGPDGNVAWRREDLGGRSTPVVMDGRLYTLCRAEPGTQREGEKVVCVDAASGETIWENRFNVYLSDVPDTRVGWSAVVADPETASVYALGVCGLFQCIDARTGQTKWSVPMHEQLGLLSTYGGRTNFPVICDDLVIVSAVLINWGERAKPAHTFVAFDKRTGDVVWLEGTSIGPYDTTYSSPTVAVLNGQKTLVFGSGDGAFWAFQARTGRPLWKIELSRRGINTPPLVAGDMIFAAHSEENVVGTSMGTVVAIDTSTLGDIAPAESWSKTPDIGASAVRWRVDELMDGRSQPLLVGNRLWVCDDRAKLWILDATTGETVGKRFALGRMMRASLLSADGKVYAFESNGRWAIYRPDDKAGATEVSKGRLPSGEEVHGSPMVSHGRVYLQTTGALYCLVDTRKTPGFEPVEETARERPLSDDPQPAFAQLIPAELRVRPGESHAFAVRLFNAHGQQVKTETTPKFQVSGGGAISSDGVFTAAADSGHEAVAISVQVGDLHGSSRVRVIPDLPWKFDFDDGQVPVTFVGARYRHVVIDDDLLQSFAQQDPVTAQLYIYLYSGFVNSGRPALVFDNSTPDQRWTQFQRVLNLSTTSLEEARQAVDPSLERLVAAGVLSERTWESIPEIGVRLTVKKGARAIDGNGVMCKIRTLPLGTRSQCWFGHSDLSNYTIRADVRGDFKDNKLPDIGLTAQGYSLDLQGEKQQLEIRTWAPQLRMAKTVDFPWQPNVWYTMKLQASLADGKAFLRGKVWPRDTSEPIEWLIEAVDESPNLSGSPGLFGNAKDAEIYLDNIEVTSN